MLLPVLQSRTEAGLSLSGKIFGLVLDWLVAGSMYFTINQPTPLNSEHLQRRASRPGPHPIGGLLPFEPPVRRVRPQVRDVAVLGEGLAGAGEVRALISSENETVRESRISRSSVRNP